MTAFKVVNTFIHSGYFYTTFSNPLLLRDMPNYSIDSVSELTRWSATGNCEWRSKVPIIDQVMDIIEQVMFMIIVQYYFILFRPHVVWTAIC